MSFLVLYFYNRQLCKNPTLKKIFFTFSPNYTCEYMSAQEDQICNDAVYQQVYQQHAEAIHRFAYFKCGDTHKAADITQEAFIKLWQNCAKVSLQKASSFLYTVANNLFLNDVAHEKVKLNYQSEKIHTSSVHDEEVETADNDYLEQLKAAIENLTPAQREAFLLNIMEGKKYAEIADILNISIKAVEKRIGGALKSIRAELKK